MIVACLNSFKDILYRIGLLTKNNKVSNLKSLTFFSLKNISFFFNTIIYNLLNIYSHCDNFNTIKNLMNYYVKWSYILTLKMKYKKFQIINNNLQLNIYSIFKYQSMRIND